LRPGGKEEKRQSEQQEAAEQKPERGDAALVRARLQFHGKNTVAGKTLLRLCAPREFAHGQVALLGDEHQLI
jgi:hypothetical protein